MLRLYILEADLYLKIDYQSKDSEHPTFTLPQEGGNIVNLSLLHTGESRASGDGRL